MRFTGKAQKKPLELLKALIAFGGRDVSETKLADALWPEAEGDAAAQALATTLFRLRKLIGEQVIRRQESRLTLDSTCCWVDCWEFQRLASETSGDPLMCLAKLRKLHQGPFLDGAENAPWAQPLRQRLQARFARLTQKPNYLLARRSTDSSPIST
jgi:two-component SAPR family response regulator